MSDNPFSEPPGSEQRTVLIRPVPGGRQGGAAAPQAAPSSAAPPPIAPPPIAPYPPPPAAPAYARAASPPSASTPAAAPLAPAEPGEPVGPLATGQSPLVMAATPLLQLLGRLRNTFNPPDAGELRLRAMQAVRDFETAGRAAAIPNEVLHPARYALCASIDDVVLHTRWGAASPWVQASLVSTFHQEVISGEGFFHQLAALKREPARHFMLLELMYFCLSLGYQGQYRLARQGPAQLELLREDLYQTLVRLRPAYEQGLSPRWLGIEAPYRPARAVVPVWVMALAALAVLTLCWWFWSDRLNGASDATLARAGEVPPRQMPGLARLPPPPEPRPVIIPPPPPPDRVVEHLHRFLEPEIRAGLVTVAQTPQQVRVRIFNRGMFERGSATVRPDFTALLERIGEALNDEQGRVQVIGHTDNLPIHTLQFPSNFQLSVARAQAAGTILLRRLADPQRLTTQGEADREPIHDNETEEHRAENRRIEVTLERRS